MLHNKISAFLPEYARLTNLVKNIIDKFFLFYSKNYIDFTKKICRR